jgi:hypothetical protein
MSPCWPEYVDINHRTGACVMHDDGEHPLHPKIPVCWTCMRTPKLQPSVIKALKRGQKQRLAENGDREPGLYDEQGTKLEVVYKRRPPKVSRQDARRAFYAREREEAIDSQKRMRPHA